MVLCSHCHMLT